MDPNIHLTKMRPFKTPSFLRKPEVTQLDIMKTQEESNPPSSSNGFPMERSFPPLDWKDFVNYDEVNDDFVIKGVDDRPLMLSRALLQ